MLLSRWFLSFCQASMRLRQRSHFHLDNSVFKVTHLGKTWTPPSKNASSLRRLKCRQCRWIVKEREDWATNDFLTHTGCRKSNWPEYLKADSLQIMMNTVPWHSSSNWTWITGVRKHLKLNKSVFKAQTDSKQQHLAKISKKRSDSWGQSK